MRKRGRETKMRAPRRPRARFAAASALALFLIVGAAVASAAEAPTRAEYVPRLEAICKPDAEATQRAMKGARTDIQRERFSVAATKFAKAEKIFGQTVRKIAAVPRPSADAARLDQWFVYLNRQESYLGQITANLKAGRGIAAQRLISRFIHTGNLSNHVVLAFGFDYCSFKFSRYG
jgi:hypothetical protein